jgi:(p)ppGpp synthase/HD superfamily hydrolase
MPAALSPRYIAALDYAMRAHGTQTRKGTAIPYVAHLMSVSALVLEHGGDEDLAIAALLHDVVEDCGPEHQEPIGERFGQRVLGVVLACSDSVERAGDGRKEPWRVRKERYIRHMGEASADTLLVSCCDKLHNASSILRDHRALGPGVWSRFSGGKEGTLWYFDALCGVFRRRSTPPSAELNRVVQALVAEADSSG